MQYLFVFALLSTLGAFFTQVRRSNRRYHHHPNVTDELDDLDDYDFDHRQRQYPPYPHQQNVPPGHYYPPPQQYPYPLYQQPYAPPQYPYQPPQYPPQYPMRPQNPFGGGMMPFLTVLIMAGLMMWLFYQPGRATHGSAIGAEPTSVPKKLLLPPLGEDIYVVWLRACRTQKEVDLLKGDLGENKIIKVVIGETVAACIVKRSKSDAKTEISMWKNYRSREIEEYGLQPEVVNLRDICDRMAVSRDGQTFIGAAF